MKPDWIKRLKSAPMRLRMRHLPAAIFGLLVVVLAVWALPRRVERIVSSDGAKIWDSQKAPPRQAITWERPRNLVPGKGALKELATPRFADEGTTLYFSRKTADGRADIYRSQRIEGAWSKPEPVAAWNTPDDELGPALSPEGNQAVFYSNRSGGEGGFDLYHSERKGKVWSPPRNLGPKVNSPADDVEPAIGPDGSLYFSSNRLRSNRGARFDLYSADRTSRGGAWAVPEPLTAINLPGSNARAPYVSPSGTSLYFASDRVDGRAARSGKKDEAANLDLYRAVWNGAQFVEGENLGTEINTPANETEPGLSAEGFTLVFSSNRSGASELFESRAQEVYLDSAWDASNLKAVASVWWQTLLFVLGCVALVLIWRASKRWVFEQASSVRFFALSVLVHAVFLMSLTTIPLAKIIAQKAEEFGVMSLETQLFGDNDRPAKKEIATAYTKLADLPSNDVVLVPEIARQETEPMSVPEADEKPTVTLPRQIARGIVPDRAEAAPEPPPQAVTRPLELARAERGRPAEVAEVIEAAPEEIAPAAAVKERPIEVPVATVARQPAMVENAAPELPAQPSPPTRLPAPAKEVAMRRDVEQVAVVIPKQVPVAVRRPRAKAEQPGEDLVHLEKVIAGEKLPELAPSETAKARVSRVDPDAEKPGEPEKSIEIAAVAPLKIELAKRQAEGLREGGAEGRPEPRVASLTMPKDTVMPGARRPRAMVEDVAPIDAAPVPGAAPVESPIAGAQVALARGGVAAPAISSDGGNVLEGPRKGSGPRLVVGVMGKARVDAPPSFGPLVTTLARLPSRAHRVAVVEETAGMEAMFTLRQPETRREFINIFGGNEASEAAVDRGLAWLAAQQEKDGYWSLEKQGGIMRSDTGGTGLALLPFLAAGHSPQAGKYQENVSRGLKYLIAHQKPDGDLMGPQDAAHWRMYAHAIATIALCEALGISKQPELKEPTQRALNFIVKTQNPATGGWRYSPGEAGDTSVVGWMVMALKSGEMAGLPAPQSAYVGAQKWLAAVESNKPTGGYFGYTDANATASMTAEGLLCLQFMGLPRNHPRMIAGAELVLKNLPDPTRDTSYAWYYGTQMMYHMQGEYWKAWNGKLRDMLVSTQVTAGPTAGTWDPRDKRELQGGRLYTTSLKLLMLEIYYRHLPLYQQLEE